MANAKKCDRCEKLYEYYDHIECNDVQVNRVVIGPVKSGVPYDLCPECCFDFVRWLVDPELVPMDEKKVIKIVEPEVDTTLYADGIPIMTQKTNGEIEWHNQINVDGAVINPEYIMDNIVLENKEESEDGKC